MKYETRSVINNWNGVGNQSDADIVIVISRSGAELRIQEKLDGGFTIRALNGALAIRPKARNSIDVEVVSFSDG